eukprot:5695879-Lingulodinium_polyedra.AAC.1
MVEQKSDPRRVLPRALGPQGAGAPGFGGRRRLPAGAQGEAPGPASGPSGWTGRTRPPPDEHRGAPRVRLSAGCPQGGPGPHGGESQPDSARHPGPRCSRPHGPP